jgi:TonB-dependent SusC/RagA subfamily outer membrane receptor
VQVGTNNGQPGATSTIRVRGISNLQGNGEPLVVLDGVYTTWADVQSSVNVSNIDHVEVLKEAAAFSIYGSRAANGVIIINSKVPNETGEKKGIKSIATYKPLPIVKNWYDVLKDANVTGINTVYKELLTTNKNNYIFFIRAAEKFKQFGEIQKAIEALSNLVEINMENHELLRACAYMLESWGLYTEAIKIYEQVKNIKGEEPQTYRDLALAMSANKQYKEALTLLESIPVKHWGNYEDKFRGIKSIIINEWNNTLKQAPKTIDSTFKLLQANMPVDIRICLDWNRDNTDIDLHVIDALQEEVYYSHKESKMGGRISNDFTQGYGPEEFLLKKALPGKYKAFINYYGDTQQGAIVPTVVKTTVFRNYGKPNETKEVYVMVLHKLGSSNTAEEKQYLAEITIPR